MVYSKYVIVNTCIKMKKINKRIVIIIDNHKSNSNTIVLIAVLPPAAKESRAQCFSKGGKRTTAMSETCRWLGGT